MQIPSINTLPSVPLTCSRELPHACAVYVLCEDFLILFVGATKDLRHTVSNSKNLTPQVLASHPFATVCWMEVPVSDLLTVKRAWVRDFKPALQTNPVTSHPLRRTYTGMIHRCHKVTKGPSYKNYRAKGVQVCERWLNSFEDFVEDMGPKPSPAHSIERLNSNSDYCPENCVWADRTAQANNKSDNKLIEAFGRTQTRAQWANEFGIDYFVLRGRLLRMSPEEALTMEDATRCRIETIDGVSRPLAEWCRRHNMPYKTVLGRVNDHNWDVRKALTTPVAKQTRDLTHNGITMPLAQWARKVGLTEGCLRDRLKRMSLAEAIETPIQRKRISRSR